MKRLILASLLLALCACSKQDEATSSGPKPVTLAGTLDLELRSKADVSLVVQKEQLSAELTLTDGFGVAKAGESLQAEGRVEAFPEAELTLYAARASQPALADGPCGSEPISLALALHRRGDNAYVAGSLTAYCGSDVFHGVPARAPLRLTGSLPLPAE